MLECNWLTNPVVHSKETHHVGWALMFFMIAVVAGIFGFGGIAGTAAGIAQILFFVFVILLIAALVFGRRVIT